MERFPKILAVVVVISFSVFLVFVGVVCGVFLISTYRDSTSSTNMSVSKKPFQILEWNPETDSHTMSFAKHTSTRNVEAEGMCYQNEKGNYVLISNFGSREYKCRGTCYCFDESKNVERRNAAVVAMRSVKYLFAAFSVSIAVKSASAYFENECQEKMKYECASDRLAVKSEVDSCESVEADVESDIKADESGDYTWICQGHCINMVFDYEKENLFPEYHRLFDMMKDFGCERLKLRREILAKTSREAQLKFNDGELYGGRVNIKDTSTLFGFCAAHSEMVYDYDDRVHWYCRTPWRSPYGTYSIQFDNTNPHCEKISTK